jgi:hypothetical protein
MKGRMEFSFAEAEEIRALLRDLKQPFCKKRNWKRLREIGFYISDYRSGAEAFTAEKFDRFIELGEILVITAREEHTERRTSPSV